ncbi:MAG: DUF2382 domain-containing protein [Mucilaginibacter sp.]|uniref:DUF2382 domain-containing protein n=1 Tax=Mucilaginibacter sp. TaxID=1882438 RepID=UPI0034E5D99B
MATNEYGSNAQLLALSGSDFEIADGQPNIKGWDVKDAQGKQIGDVDDLIFNPNNDKVVYLVVDQDDNELDLDEDKKVLIPIGLAELHESDDDVLLPSITVAQLNQLPAYEKGNITSETESTIRNILGGGAVAAGASALTGNEDFYQHEHFNDAKLYGRRQKDRDDLTSADQTTTSIPVIEEKMEVGKREVETGGVRLKSRVVQENVQENVNLRSEHVRVEETPVNRPATAADLETFKEGTIEMKEYAEVPVVSKEAFVTGEVSLEKEVEERDETVQGTVRKTEVETENFTDDSAKLTNKSTKLSNEESGDTFL